MTVPVIDPGASTEGVPENAVPIRLPIMVIEGLETSDGRYIEPGTLSVRDLPIPLYAKTKSTHGEAGDAATWHVGSITSAERIPGPEAEGYSGQALPEGTFVWTATGWMYTDVPASPDKSAYQLVKDKALRGNSVDMTEVIAEYQTETGDLADEGTYARISMQRGVIAATTLVGIPAFADSYIVLDGESLPAVDDAEVLTAGAREPAWLSAELGDDCSPCAAGDQLPESSLTAAVGDDFDAPEPDFSTSGMVALLPANPNMLIVPGGDQASELHLTLAYLGDRIDEWTPEQVAAVHQVARRLTDAAYAEELRRAEAEAAGQPLDEYATPYVSDAQKGPLAGNIFAHAVFNPNGGDTADKKPAAVYLLDGSGQRADIDYLASSVQMDTERQVGDVLFPKQYYPFVPHVTAGYGLDPSQLTYTGPVEFDRIRVAIGNDVVDYPLGGGQPALVASAATLPPAEWFADPGLDGPTALTVTEDGRVYGHIATWDTCHIGFPGSCVTPPRSATDYAYYKVHPARALSADGDVVNIPVGYGTVSASATSGGHASTALSASETAAHYDNTCTAAFELNVGEDAHGIWCAGRLIPGLDAATEHKARGAVFSGDWRMIRGNLEMVAALAVNTPGFPIPHARVASGAALAIVAAGTVPRPEPEAPVTVSTEGEFAEVLSWVRAQKLASDRAGLLADLGGLLAEVPDAEVLADEGEVALLLAADADHPWFSAAAQLELYCDDGCDEALTAAGKTLHLPPYIKRISKHLRKGGMSESHAIATAVNAAKKMCRTGDTSWPGKQDINPGSRAEACAAVAQWKADRPGAS
jgi:hypothetical protein